MTNNISKTAKKKKSGLILYLNWLKILIWDLAWFKYIKINCQQYC